MCVGNSDLVIERAVTTEYHPDLMHMSKKLV